jgi:hypothetical protein
MADISTGKTAQIIRLPGACTDPVKQSSLRGRRPKATSSILSARWNKFVHAEQGKNAKRISEIESDLAFNAQMRDEQCRRYDRIEAGLRSELMALGVSDSWQSKEVAK